MEFLVLHSCLPVGVILDSSLDESLTIYIFSILVLAKFWVIIFQVIYTTVTELSFPPGAVASAAKVASSPGFCVGGHVAEVETLVVSSGHRRHPHGFESHHQTVHVC